MANGKHGDHPFTDIVVHGKEVISPDVTNLVRKIYEFGDENINRVVSDLLWFMRPELANESWRASIVSSLQSDLRTLEGITEELRKVRGWESGDKS